MKEGRNRTTSTISRKRKRSESREDSSSRRQKNEGITDKDQNKKVTKELVWVGDSMIRGMTRRLGLNAHAWREGWDLEMVRGGTTSDITERLRQIDVKKYKKIVIAAGTNDLVRMRGLNEQGKCQAIQKAIENYKKMIRACKEADSQLCIMVPPVSTRHYTEDREDLLKGLERMEEDNSEVIFHDPQNRRDPEEYIRRKLYDGLHYHDECFANIVNKVCRKLNVKEPGEDPKPLEKKEHIPPQSWCWRCGNRHKGTCRANTYCNRCDSEEHMEKVCVYRCYFCSGCGQRGHANNKCKSAKAYEKN